MGWIEMLDRTYDRCLDVVGKEINDDPILLPIAHSTANAQIELAVDMEGNFVRELTATIQKNGRDEITVIPVTEDSASRGNGNFPHALCDKLCYVAGDYSAYTKDKKEEYFEAYLQNLKRWAESDYSHPWIKAVYAYLEKGCVIEDLLSVQLLKLDENGLLAEKDNKIHQQPQADALIRFAVVQNDKTKKLWKSQELYDLYAKYYYSTLTGRALNYASGREEICSEKHPSKIRNTADKAKLISGNDDVGFTYRGRFQNKSEAVGVGYETSQKAHNALRWLLKKQGYSDAGSAIVVWKLPGQEVEQEPETDPLGVPDIFADTPNAFSFAWKTDSLPEDEEDLDTGDLYARQLNLAMAGYADKFHADDKVIMIAVDAATPGRLSITYYHEFAGNDFIQRLIHWHRNCTWRRRVKLKNSDKKVWVESAPSPKEIALAAFGIERGNAYLSCDDKLLKATVQRILPCVVGLNPKIPADIVRAAVNRASEPLAYSSFVWRNQVLAVACAMIKYNKYEGRVDAMEQEKNRSYLFGGLLAIMEAMEQNAMYTSSGSNEERLTNAKKLWNVYTRRPAKTYERLYSKIMQGYMAKLKSGTRYFFENEMMEIVNELREIEGFDNQPLKEGYLLGYYAQREKLMNKSKEKQQEKEGGEE